MSSSPSPWRLNPAAALTLHRLGHEAEPLILLDQALADPAALVDYATTVAFAPAYGPAGGYPGLRAPAPLDYVGLVVRAIDPVLREAFGLGAVKLGRAEVNYSLATLPADALAPAQREPHVDTTDPLQFAILHYLCPPRFGGTAFYRHRATGYETLTDERLDSYEATRAGERTREDAGYIAGDTAAFVQTFSVDAAFNRLVAYRSRLLHSGVIAPGTPLDADPRRGRLTANIFLTYLPIG